jgi:hypothetical protein
MRASGVVLEQGVQFSESLLWEAQRRYFDEAGVNAWSGAVPFYITSNPFIANAYAQVFIRWVQDLLTYHQADPTSPFYIFELGTGSGRFSFMTIRRLVELQKVLNISAKIVYVMTDFTASNLTFWENHEALLPFVESGQLDFALYDMEKDLSITLVKQAKTLTPKDIKNPIALIGNYIFDTISADAFYVENGQLNESLLTVKTPSENVEAGMPLNLENLECTFHHHPIHGRYYENDIWNQALEGYSSLLSKGAFLFPTGGLKSLDMFRALSDNKLLLITTDKGYAFPDEIEAREDPKLVFHGSFSMTVNFHGIGEYFKALGGDVAFQDPKDSIKTVAYTMGVKLQDLPELQSAVDAYLKGFGPGDYFSLHRNMREIKDPSISMTTLLAQLSLSHWDPYVLSCFIPRVLADLPSSSRPLIQGFAAGAKKILNNIYIMPGTEDHYFNTGLLFHTAEEYGQAILCYEKSLKTHGEKFATYYNLGLCCYMAGQFSGSLTYFERSASLATDKRSEEWIQKVKKEMASATLKSS